MAKWYYVQLLHVATHCSVVVEHLHAFVQLLHAPLKVARPTSPVVVHVVML